MKKKVIEREQGWWTYALGVPKKVDDPPYDPNLPFKFRAIFQISHQVKKEGREGNRLYSSELDGFQARTTACFGKYDYAFTCYDTSNKQNGDVIVTRADGGRIWRADVSMLLDFLQRAFEG